MKFTNLTDEIIQGLPTGTILKLKKNRYLPSCETTQLGMVLRGVAHENDSQNIISGEIWKPLDKVKLEDVKGIYQPQSNFNYLSDKGGHSHLDLLGTKPLWLFKEKTDRELQLEKLHKQAQDIADQIAELD